MRAPEPSHGDVTQQIFDQPCEASSQRQEQLLLTNLLVQRDIRRTHGTDSHPRRLIVRSFPLYEGTFMRNADVKANGGYFRLGAV